MMIGWQNPLQTGKFRPDPRPGGSSAPSPSTSTTIRDVKGAFNAVREKHSLPVTYRNRRLMGSMPAGYNGFPKFHQQGVQKLPSGGFVVSGSTRTGSASYFYVTDSGGNVINVTIIESGAFSHAGGIQVFNNILAVGTENPSNSKGGSRIYFYDLSNPSQPRKLAFVISRPTETAGAVGLTQTSMGYLCVVGNYDSKRLDFYRFSSPESADGGGVRSFGRNVSEDGWQSYQNLNLFTDSAQGVWIVGMHTDMFPSMKDWADLWRVTLRGSEYQLRKEGKKHHVSSTDGSRFVYGSGYCYNRSRSSFEVFSVEACMNSSGVSRGAGWNL